MSGLPPGIRHVVTTRFAAKSKREIDPADRFVTYRTFESRLTYKPWAPAPVDTNRST